MVHGRLLNPRLYEPAIPLAFVFLWSSAFVAARAGLPYASPIFYLALRFSIAAAVLGAFLLLLRRLDAWQGVPLMPLVLGGILINGLYLSGAYIALETINAATMALIGAFHPLATALLAVRLLGERLRLVQWMGLAIGLVGAALVVGPGSAAWSEARGVLFAVGGVACMAIGTVYHRMRCRTAPLVQANAVQQGSAAAFCLMAAVAFENVEIVPTATLVVTLLYLALVVSIGAMALFILMLRKGTASQVASNFYLTPGMTAVLGWLVLGETLETRAIFGFVIASVGVWLANRSAPD